jgi:acyltransferase
MRVGNVDSVKGLGILLVVLGHTKNLPDSIHWVIYSFHMPLFFILSGVFFDFSKFSLSKKAYLSRKFRNLIVPAWVLGLICSLPFVLLLIFDKISIHDFFLRFLGTFSGSTFADENFFSTPVWFLFALFFVEFFAAIFVGRFFYLFSFFCIVIGLIVSFYYSDLYVPFNVHIALTSFVFFFFGFVFKKKILFFHYPFSYTLVLLFFTVVLMVFAPGENISLARNFLGEGFYILFNIVFALVFSCMVIAFSKYYNCSVLRWFGLNTIVILGFDFYTNSLVFKFLGLLSWDEFWLIGFFLRIVLLVCICFIVSRFSMINRFIYGVR